MSGVTVRRRQRRATVSAALAIVVLGAGAAALLLGGEQASVKRPEPPGLHVDAESIGGRCSDRRSPEQVRSAEQPWCTVARAIAAAPEGSTVLLRGGSYGQLSIVDQEHARPITLKAYPGERVEMPGGLHIEDSAGFHLEGLRVSSSSYTSSIFASERIAVRRSSFSPRGLLIRASSDVEIAGNNFHDIVRVPGAGAPDGYALYVQAVLRGTPGEEIRRLTVRGNRFSDIPNDGIQIAGGANRVHDITIEGNEFSGIRREVDTDHPDSIQVIGADGIAIRSNVFRDSEVALMIKDDVTRSLVVENNLMIGATGGGIQAQLWDTPGARVEHNTIWNSQLGGLRLADLPTCCGVPSDIVVRHNIIDKYTADDSSWISDQDSNVIAAGPLRGPGDVAIEPSFSPDWRPSLPAGLEAGAKPRPSG